MVGNTNLPTPLNMPHSIIIVMITLLENPSESNMLEQQPIRTNPIEMFKNMNNQHFWKNLSFMQSKYENFDFVCFLNFNNAYLGLLMRSEDNSIKVPYPTANA